MTKYWYNQYGHKIAIVDREALGIALHKNGRMRSVAEKVLGFTGKYSKHNRRNAALRKAERVVNKVQRADREIVL